MKTSLLYINSWYNNKITDDIIYKYINNIFFGWCNYYTLKYFIDKYKISTFYTILDITENVNNYDIINNYADEKTKKYHNKFIYINNNSNKIKYIGNNNKILWLDIINYNKFFINTNLELWNIPLK